MRLSAIIIPPRAVLDELDAVVRSVSTGRRRRPWTTPVRPTSGEGQHAAPRRGLLGRRDGAAAPPAPPEPGPLTDQLARVPVLRMHIPITTFGHLTRGATEELTDALRSSAATWSMPTLRLAGGAALEWAGDKSVWAKLDGDLDRLQVIGKGVPRVVQPLGLFVDRRQFRPLLAVGTITEETTAPYLEDLVAALTRFEGMSWTQETLSLMKGQPEGGEAFEEMEALPFAAS